MNAHGRGARPAAVRADPRPLRRRQLLDGAVAPARYAGPGATIGAAMTFGYLAGRRLAAGALVAGSAPARPAGGVR